jgi:hypothetical protein
MGSTDGAIIGLTKIVNAGTASGKWNLVIVAEGYTSRELTQFDTHARAFATTLLATPPFTALAAAINVYKLDVSSTDSGADDPTACGGTGAVVNTFFDASFCNSGLRRFLLVDSDAVLDAVEAALPEYDAVVVMVNSSVHGGSGNGQVAVCSRAPGANNIALHELGHTAFGLADEYSEGLGNHSSKEPAAANITVQKTMATLKWKQHVPAGTAIPTATTPGCRQNVVTAAAAAGIGTYEGARRFDCRVYRPANVCKMRTLNDPFCDVCRAHIKTILTKFLSTT